MPRLALPMDEEWWVLLFRLWGVVDKGGGRVPLRRPLRVVVVVESLLKPVVVPVPVPVVVIGGWSSSNPPFS
eukprot:CAMPEP_0172401548 /NCGR_PEP_ID=MMETSP1061-20121228/50728_1 /TAXON_ID=37318 /ORGANISM="Pseudo-nitzschia pungens, Strain cf. pungens" /LENGTH=71 /DNA_ID=CAMNT_0013135225 /DNA_START=41 /DNA_END=253 /DNA_ORIENTATION=+